MLQCIPENIVFVGSKEPTLEILYGTKTVFTRSAITPPKVNRFG